jgi:hypothetical protein
VRRDYRDITEQLNAYISRRDGDWALPLLEEFREHFSNFGLAGRSLRAIAWRKDRRGFVKRADDKLEVGCLVRFYECLNSCQASSCGVLPWLSPLPYVARIMRSIAVALLTIRFSIVRLTLK